MKDLAGGLANQRVNREACSIERGQRGESSNSDIQRH